MSKSIALLSLIALLTAHAVASETYQESADFIDSVFRRSSPQTGSVWITKELIGPIEEILGHTPGVRRVRYWGQGERTAWILEEIGKEKLITTGIVIDNGRVERIKVLVFRESRGWEIRYPFFTDQFTGVTLTEEHKLDRTIDGISGATLSVTAMKKLARLALYFDQQIRLTNDPSPEE